jgi:hypothetical protein
MCNCLSNNHRDSIVGLRLLWCFYCTAGSRRGVACAWSNRIRDRHTRIAGPLDWRYNSHASLRDYRGISDRRGVERRSIKRARDNPGNSYTRQHNMEPDVASPCFQKGSVGKPSRTCVSVVYHMSGSQLSIENNPG